MKPACTQDTNLDNTNREDQQSGTIADTAVPDYVPVNVLNKFEFCPRLFYLVWVQGEYETTKNIAEGTYIHRNVDKGGGSIEAPNDNAISTDGTKFRAARSVELSSKRLGLIAKADILEQRDGQVIPVEVKRGRPPKHGPAWMPEQVQLCAIALLLREHGYKCSKGEFYFAQTRKRVSMTFDDRIIDYTLKTLEKLRRIAAVSTPPPPLIDSPKCPTCCVVGICLPDETNLHIGHSKLAPRRLTPRDSAARPLYVNTAGARVGINSGRVVVKRSRKKIAQMRLIDVSQISLYGNVQISSQMMRAAFRAEIPVCWFSYGGWFQGIAHGLPSKNVNLRRRQVAIAAQAGLPIAQAIIEGKVRNTRTFLMRNSRSKPKLVLEQLKDLYSRIRESESIRSLLGLEGTAARLYFSEFSTMLRTDKLGIFEFKRRNRRPPTDPINCLLSFVYALLTKDLTATVFAVGFDPFLGVFHQPRYGRPALALDIAEEFRPIIGESVVVGLVNNGEISSTHFTTMAGGVSLTREGRSKVISAYERRLDTKITHPIYGYRITYRRVLEVQARVLAAHMIGELPKYTAFTTR